jgi:cytochrome c
MVLAAGFLFVQPAMAGDLPEGDAARGEKLFSACAGCHQVGKGAQNKVGPHLDGLLGRPAGSVEGFKYSSAMRAAGEGGMTWTAENIAKYLEKPREFIPGNRMSYRGMPKAQDRADLVAWLEVVSREKPGEAGATAEVVAAPGFAEVVMQLEGDPEYGEYLAGECVTCHQASGHADGIPSIVGLPKKYFLTALFEYKNNVRTNEVMKLRVQNLTNEELAALAAYFENLDPQ